MLSGVIFKLTSLTVTLRCNGKRSRFYTHHSSVIEECLPTVNSSVVLMHPDPSLICLLKERKICSVFVFNISQCWIFLKAHANLDIN